MTMTSVATMRGLRAIGLSDASIGRTCDPPISRQRVHAILGPRPAIPPVEPYKEPTVEEFGKALRTWRKARGLTQLEVARLLRVTQMSINTWERGRGGCALAGTIMLTLSLLDTVEALRPSK